MRRCLLLLIPILAACGGSEPTTPPPVSKQLSLAIVGGNQQAAPVTSLLPVPIKVQVTESPTGTLRIQRIDGLSLSGTPGSTPAPGRLVRFVPDSSCGAAAVGYGITDSLGVALDRWTLGTHAKPCRMVTIGVDQKTGEIQAYDTVYATALPGAVDTLTARTGWYLFTGESAPLSDFVARAADRYGNGIAAPTVTFTLAEGWTVADGRLTAPGTERLDDMALAVGARSATVRVGAMRDLSNVAAWDATGQCVLQPGAVSDGATYVDSLTYAVAIGRAAYQSAGVAGSPLKLGIAEFGYEGNRIRYWATGRVDTVTATGVLTPYQRGDSLYWALVSPGQSERASARASDAPVAYVGGNALCGVGVGQVTSYRPLQMVAR